MKVKRNRKGQFAKSTDYTFRSVAIMILVALLLGVFIAKYIMPEADKVECIKLQKQSVEYRDAGFYITKIEKEMCDDLGVAVVAPVQ